MAGLVGAEGERAVMARDAGQDGSAGGEVPRSPVMLWTGLLLLTGILICGCARTRGPGHLAGEVTPDFESLFPSWPPGPEWRLQGRPATYIPSNLFVYINGQAELFLSYGFQRVVTGTFVKTAAPDEYIVADVYDMGSKLNAFGMYSMYEAEDRPPLDVGTAGLRSDHFLALYRDRYFVLLKAEEPALAAAVGLARGIARCLPEDAGPPVELSYLPDAGLVRGTRRYIPEALFGYDFFPRGIQGGYHLDQSPVVLFVVLCVSEAEAVTVLERYRAFIEGEGISPMLLEALGDEGFFGEEPYYGGVMVARSGRFIAGVRDLSVPSGVSVGRERLEEVLNRLQE